MPWGCPVCQTEVRHHPIAELPTVGTSYRCHVCRLELVFDGDHMAVAPVDADHSREAESRRARAIPAPIEGKPPTKPTTERRKTERRATKRRKAQRRKPTKPKHK